MVLSGDTAAEAQESRVGIFLLFLRGAGGDGGLSSSLGILSRTTEESVLVRLVRLMTLDIS